VNEYHEAQSAKSTLFAGGDAVMSAEIVWNNFGQI
jgi:hypothetical protein